MVNRDKVLRYFLIACLLFSTASCTHKKSIYGKWEFGGTYIARQVDVHDNASSEAALADLTLRDVVSDFTEDNKLLFLKNNVPEKDSYTFSLKNDTLVLRQEGHTEKYQVDKLTSDSLVLMSLPEFVQYKFKRLPAGK